MCAANGRRTLQPKTYRRKLHSGTEQVGSNMRALLILGTHHLEIWMSTNSELKTTSNANGTGMSANGAMGADGPRSVPSACIQTGTNGQSRERFSATVKKRRFGLSSVVPTPKLFGAPLWAGGFEGPLPAHRSRLSLAHAHTHSTGPAHLKQAGECHGHALVRPIWERNTINPTEELYLWLICRRPSPPIAFPALTSPEPIALPVCLTPVTVT